MENLMNELPVQEKTVIVGIIHRQQKKRQAEEYLNELRLLAATAGANVCKQFVQKLDTPHSTTFVGKGKLEEISSFVNKKKIDSVIFDDELTPLQLRHLEQILKVKIIDRTHLILDIFARRARTAHAKIQVSLAQYQYMLPRLTRMWTHLERQQGGIGLRGPGETQIETDRRIILDKISHLKKQLKKIDKQKITQRKNRREMVIVALVGYTNVGKSTMMNLVSKSDVFAEDKLFATLDTTVRKVVTKNLPFLLIDTVGFIRKLPHGLVQSFKSTLDEVREADVLLHVVDISHQGFEEQMEVVDTTLKKIGARDKPLLYIFNKIDAFTYEQKDEDDLSPKTKKNFTLNDWKNSWIAKNNNPAIFISAKEKTNLKKFKQKVYEEVKKVHIIRFSHNDSFSAKSLDLMIPL
jgi:GTP-binding protein HflX